MIKYIVISNFRGTCSSVEILKGYMLIFRNAEDVHAHLSECWRGSLHGQRKVGKPWVRWCTGQEACLTQPSMFEPEVFLKQMYCIEESTCDTVGTLKCQPVVKVE